MTLIHTHILCRTPLDEGSASRKRYACATQHAQKINPMPPAGFEPVNQEASGSKATGVGLTLTYETNNLNRVISVPHNVPMGR